MPLGIGGFGGPRDRRPGPRERRPGPGPRERRPGPRERGPRREGLFSGVRFFHGPIRFNFFGRPIFLSTGRQVGFLCGFIALLVMIVSTIATFVNLSDNKKDRDYYKNELANDKVYLQIINNAEKGVEGYYTTTASYNKNEVGSKENQQDGTVPYYYEEYYGSYNYYYTIVYKFNDKNGATWYDETKTFYTNSPTKGTIEIAYCFNDSGSVISVETGYKKICTDNIPYYELEITNLDSTIKTQTVAAVILVIILAGIITLIVLSIIKTFKKSKEKQELEQAKMKAEVKEAEAKAEEAQAQADKQHRYCVYCGAKFPDGDNKCPNCGSVHFEVKK